MKTINVAVRDELVVSYGLEAIKKSLEEELAYQGFKLLEHQIQEGLIDAHVDWEKEFEQKREEAFGEYQHRRLGH